MLPRATHQPHPALLRHDEGEEAGVHAESEGRRMEESWLPKVGTRRRASGLVSTDETAVAMESLEDETSVSTMTEPERTATMRS